MTALLGRGAVILALVLYPAAVRDAVMLLDCRLVRVKNGTAGVMR